MKKSLRIVMALLLAAVLAASCFTGCQKKSFEEKYGISISDKAVTYDGEEYSVEIEVNKEILKDREYTVEYTYSKDGQTLSGTSFKDAGVYDVTASVLVAGEDTPTTLSAKLTINKANVKIALGNFFLRQGSSLSSLGTASVPESTVLKGSDKIADLGKVSYEVYQGSTKVTDLSALKPTTKQTDALQIKLKFEKEPTNYNFEDNDGKLYVLSSADYSVAERMKKSIASVPTSETINTFTYDQMKAFKDVADDVVKTYPTTSDIQRLMSGTVDVSSISSLLKTAEERISMVYSLDSDIDSSVGSVVWIAADHQENRKRIGKDDYLTEMRGDKKSSLTEVEYNDKTCFAVVIYDSAKYNFKGVTVRGKDFTTWNYALNSTNTSTHADVWGVVKERIAASNIKSKVLTGTEGSETIISGATIYVFGTPNTKASVQTTSSSGGTTTYTSDYGDYNYGCSTGVSVNSSVLGALDGSSYIVVRPNYVNIYTLKVGGEGENATKYIDTGSTNTLKAIIPNASVLELTVKGSSVLTAISGSDATGSGKINNGDVVKLKITPTTGYVIDEVDIADETITADKFVDNAYEFTVTEDMADASGDIKINVRLINSYSLNVKIGSERDTTTTTIRNKNKDGVYSKDNAGTIKLTGDVVVSAETPSVLKEKSFTIEVTPSTNYVLSSLTLKGKKLTTNGGTETGDLTEDLLGDKYSFANNKITLDLATDIPELLSTGDVTIEAKFAEYYPLKVTASRNGVGTETATKSGKTFTTKYGKITVYSADDDELDSLNYGKKYYIEIESNDGYVPRKVSIGGTAYDITTQTKSSTEGAFDAGEYTRYQVIKGSNMYVVSFVDGSSSTTISSPCFVNNTTKLKASQQTNNYYLICKPIKTSAGEDFVIDVEFDAYYFISVSGLTSSNVGTSDNVPIASAILPIKGVVKNDGTGLDSTTILSNGNEQFNNAVTLSVDTTSAIYKVDGENTLYAYYAEKNNKLSLAITANEGKYKLLNSEWTFGEYVDGKYTVSSSKTVKTTMDEVLDKETKNSNPESGKLRPGDYIDIAFDFDGEKQTTT